MSQIVIPSPDSIKAYCSTFGGILETAPRDCPSCGGRLKGDGRRHRWVASFEGRSRVPIQRMRCTSCGASISLRPQVLPAFYCCARPLAAEVKSLWIRGIRKMAAVRHVLISLCGGLLFPLSSLYRWASRTI